jgi:hypothetical protein
VGKKKVEVEKLGLSDLRMAIVEIRRLDGEIKSLEKAKKSKEASVIVTLGLGGVIEFKTTLDEEMVNLRAKVARAMRRTIPWRVLAMDLAKKVYPEKSALVRWLRRLVREFPKKATAPYVRITTTELVEAEEEV